MPAAIKTMVANTRLYDNLGLAPDASEEQIK